MNHDDIPDSAFGDRDRQPPLNPLERYIPGGKTLAPELVLAIGFAAYDRIGDVLSKAMDAKRGMANFRERRGESNFVQSRHSDVLLEPIAERPGFKIDISLSCITPGHIRRGYKHSCFFRQMDGHGLFLHAVDAENESHWFAVKMCQKCGRHAAQCRGDFEGTHNPEFCCGECCDHKGDGIDSCQPVAPVPEDER